MICRVLKLLLVIGFSSSLWAGEPSPAPVILFPIATLLFLVSTGFKL